MEIFKNLIQGAVIGIANIIPGVSGGTMALVLGIYERLINAIRNISFKSIKTAAGILKFDRESYRKFKDETARIDAFFLMNITIGALIAITALAQLMTYLLKNWHEPTYGFFFGLVLISVLAPYKLINRRSFAALLSCLIAMAAVLLVSNALSEEDIIKKAKVKYELRAENAVSNPNRSKIVEHSDNSDVMHKIYLFFLGAIAISAMILPGVSGSFLLLLLGGYFDILAAISNRDLPVLFVFAMGCMAGISVFSRILNYLLKKWHDITVSSLVGLVLGSLWLIWPFKNSVMIGNERVYLSNRLPLNFGTSELYTAAASLLGMAVVLIMIRIESRSSERSS